MTSKTDNALSENTENLEHSLDDVKNLWEKTVTIEIGPDVSIKSTPNLTPPQTKLKNVKRRKVVMSGKDLEGADYELLRPLGSGGMGVVFRACQLDVDRFVALKLLNAEAGAKPENREKFVAEAMVTANLDHPNIVPLYDLGLTENNELFYTMKELRGDSWFRSMPKLSETENLDILLKVCDAIAFAHSRGVIHRDLKPENIMLDDFGEVVVTDWGLAASVGHGLGADKAEILDSNSGSAGTASYMPPEMALCKCDKIGTRSDVYLLGGLLYEFTTGLKPHAGDTAINSLYKAVNNLIQKTDRSGELIDIAMKAMATDPEDRFADVKSFQKALQTCRDHNESLVLTSKAAEDLAQGEKDGDYESFTRSRFALEEAVKLWPENRKAIDMLEDVLLSHARSARSKNDFDLSISLLDSDIPKHSEFRKTVERERKRWLKRQGHGKIFRRIALGLGILVLVILAGSSVLIYMERLEALSQRDQAISAKIEAKKQEKFAREDAKRAKTTSNFLIETLMKADPSTAGGKDVTVLQVMEAMSSIVNVKFENDSQSKFILHKNIAEVFNGLLRFNQAISHMEQALRLAKEIYGEEDSRYAKVLSNLAVMHANQFEYDKAEPLLRKALRIQKESLGSESLDYAETLLSIGKLDSLKKKYSEAEKTFSQVIEICKKNNKKRPELKALALKNLLSLYQLTKNFQKAEVCGKKALALYNEVFGQNHPRFALCLNIVGSIKMEQGKFAESEAIYRKSSSIMRKAYGEENFKYLESLCHLARLCLRNNKRQEAESLCDKGLAVSVKANLTKNKVYPSFLSLRGKLFMFQRNIHEAERCLMQALNVTKSIYGKNHEEYALIANNLGFIYKARKQWKQAESHLSEAWRIYEKLDDSPGRLQTLNNLMNLYCNISKFREAKPLCKEILQYYQNKLGESHPTAIIYMENMATICDRLKESEESLAWRKKAGELKKMTP